MASASNHIAEPQTRWLPLVLLCLTGCAGAIPTASAGSSSLQESATVTLTDTGCAFDGAIAAGAGGFMIRAVNITSENAGFDLYLLHEDTTFEDWVAYNTAARKDIEAGGEGPGDPLSIADPVDLQVAVAPGGEGVLRAESNDSGTYALQCWIFPAEGTISLFTAGPVNVAGA